MLNRELFGVYRASRESDGRGGWTQSWAKIGEERGSAVLRTLVSARALEQSSEGGRQVITVTHVAYFRSGADIRRGDMVVRSDVVLDEFGNVDSHDETRGEPFAAEVLSRRVAGEAGRIAEFELATKQRGT